MYIKFPHKSYLRISNGCEVSKTTITLLAPLPPPSPSSSIMIIIVIFFLTIISNGSSLSFNFSSFDPNNRDIKYEGSAFPLDSAIQLTPKKSAQVGHATYNVELMHLWDKDSGSLSDFTANFSFSIDAQNDSAHGDGLAFFIAPPQYRMPVDGQGAVIGLTSTTMTLNSTSNPFVAIEFDTYFNVECDDIRDEHVGIDVNSLISLKSLKWNSVLDGRVMDARISYDSSSMNLCVYFTGISENKIVEQDLCHEVDFRSYLPEWVVVGFSSSTGVSAEIHRIYSSSFSSSLQPTPPPTISPPKKNKPFVKLIAGASAAATVLLLVIFVIFYKKKKDILSIFQRNIEKEAFDYKRRGEVEIPPSSDCSSLLQSQDKEFERVSGAKKIPYDLLASATNNFNEREKLGEGGFGAVFRGYLNDTEIAVKRLLDRTTPGASGYIAEVMILNQIRHKNLVQLVGWCHEKKEILLVYEYMPNRSLDLHLFSGECLLKWEQRYEIAKGLADGLRYLHEECRQCVLHRDIKSSNVMLDSKFIPKLGDFGLARIVDHDAKSQTLLGGSQGYIAPECHETGKSSKESDVFSFGVVALEIACGKRPFVQEIDDGNQVHIVKWVWELYGNGELLKAADQKLHGNFIKRQMERLMIVGLSCAHPDYSFRPSIGQAIDALRFVTELPNLPSKFPRPAVPTHTVLEPEVIFSTAPTHAIPDPEVTFSTAPTKIIDSSNFTSSSTQ